jgi:hypothetical protein
LKDHALQRFAFGYQYVSWHNRKISCAIIVAILINNKKKTHTNIDMTKLFLKALCVLPATFFLVKSAMGWYENSR